ncbi:MAG: hypothetical protein H7831_06745 [Magnetococcus sp. WYHC-3]
MPKYNEVIDHICACGVVKQLQYRPSRFKDWQCHACSMKQASAAGRIKANINNLSSSADVSKRNKILWQNQEYRNKILSKRKPKYAKVMDIICSVCGNEYQVNRRYALRKKYHVCASCTMLRKWEDQNYRDHISNLVRIQSLKQWQDTSYRQMVIESNKKTWNLRRDELSKRSRDLWLSPEYREKLAIAYTNQPRISNIQLKLYEHLDILGISYFKEGPETRIGYYVFDCFIPNSNLLIECQGDYWHMLDKGMIKDRSKFTYIDRYFPEHEVMYIWEHEFYTKDRVLDRLKLKLGLSVETVDFNFSEIELKVPNKKGLRSFLDAYHYIGGSRGGLCFGAYHNGQLVACVVYSPPVRQNIAQQFSGSVMELSRFCIHPAYHKKNFASWLIARSLKQLDVDLVISYADRTMGHSGSIYKACGFKLHHIVPADYWYIDSDNYVMTKQTLYKRARKHSVTEAEYADKFGFIQKFGGNKLCFIKNL